LAGLCRLSCFDRCSIFKNEYATLQDIQHAVIPSERIPTGQSPSAELLTQFIRYVVDHLHGDLSASALATRFLLEENMLLSAFQSHTGMALDQFVLRRRIEGALFLLKNSDSTDSSIAVRIGLGTAGAFQTAFSGYLGVSPKEYRSILQKQQAASRERQERPRKSPAYRGKNLVVGRFQQSQFSS
jgi:AraC-like DNA-binding protein